VSSEKPAAPARTSESARDGCACRCSRNANVCKAVGITAHPRTPFAFSFRALLRELESPASGDGAAREPRATFSTRQRRSAGTAHLSEPALHSSLQTPVSCLLRTTPKSVPTGERGEQRVVTRGFVEQASRKAAGMLEDRRPVASDYACHGRLDKRGEDAKQHLNRESARRLVRCQNWSVRDYAKVLPSAVETSDSSPQPRPPACVVGSAPPFWTFEVRAFIGRRSKYGARKVAFDWSRYGGGKLLRDRGESGGIPVSGSR